jgi:predicted O-linked N-acetylglucosamine transferase (SPINDLY family)
MISPAISQQISHYEAAITKNNALVSNYWWLGVSYALNNNIEEAESTWFIPLANATDEQQAAQLTADLGNTLLIAAQQQTELQNYLGALVLREYFHQLDNTCLENTLEIILLRDCCSQLTYTTPAELELNNALAIAEQIDTNLLSSAFVTLLSILESNNIVNVLDCLKYSEQSSELVDVLVTKLLNEPMRFNWSLGNEICNYCLLILPNDFKLLSYLSVSYGALNKCAESLAISEKYYAACVSDADKIQGGYYLIRSLVKNGDFDRIRLFIADYRNLLESILQKPGYDLQLREDYMMAIGAALFFSYLQDTPQQNHHCQNQFGRLYQSCLQASKDVASPPRFPAPPAKRSGVLRIGYIASTFYNHSVGWLSRWLWQYHDRNKFEIFTYCIRNIDGHEFNRKWFKEKSDCTRYFNANAPEIVAQIAADEIDILIDLDSVTDASTYWVMASKVAPVQATWLGWDASGCPGIDYFIADPYVLPDHAQSYYSEKIWRLPVTYLAVDGFEVGVPNITRADLDIPPDAIIYFNAQQGAKLNAINILPQMEIVRQVPNSYLLIKSQTDRATTAAQFKVLAEQGGLDFDRIRFIEAAPDEATHRANLQIADVMLDTFPYNGATTTLETLWMGLPLVTMVGEQFVARNSYSFMINAGITEGIAYTIAEYIDWGIRLGLDRNLRNLVQAKLQDSRQNSPLWDARKFTAQMEQAYQSMWQIHQAKLVT